MQTPSSATNVQAPPVELIHQRCPLARTQRLLQRDHRLTVGYFGGSITRGSNASNPETTSWRAQTTAWLRQNYPAAQLTEINAGIGGTGSDLGAFRCRTDLLTHNPDLVFVEFAVNDYGLAEPRRQRCLEGIVRQVWQHNPAAEIVFVYTLRKGMENQYKQNILPPVVVAHEELAAHYGISSVNVGLALWRKIERATNSWQAFTTDNVHPNDAGHALYAQQMQRALGQLLTDDNTPARVSLPAPLTHRPLVNARLVDAWDVAGDGWTKEAITLADRYPHRIAARAPGTALRHRFKGIAIGLYWLVAPDSGDVEWSLDGAPAERASSWDKYALKFTRAHYILFADDLPPGEHELRITILNEKQPQSTGHWIRIGALLEADE